jgi:NAD(P)-dependent dehydrogenase (short-subunit alcohol dehydrogenase family)
LSSETTETRVAVVTGGAGAIGGAIAGRLAEDGFAVVVIDLHGEVSADLSDADQVRAAAAKVLADHGRCDVLVHAAAISDRMELETAELEAWRRVQAVNVESFLLLAQAFAPGMKERGFGRIIPIVSDTFWSPPGENMLAYIATKGTLIAMMRTLAVGLGPDGIAVAAVAPGLTKTAGTVLVPDAEFEAADAHRPLSRPLVSEDVAAAVSFLARDEAAAMTGQILNTDGGAVLT